jgi:hypothetical protein
LLNRDRNVGFSLFFVTTVLPVLSCAPEEPSSTARNSQTSEPGGSDMTPISAVVPQPPADSGAAPVDPGFLICDPNDARYCEVSRAEDGVACAERWEDVGQHLNCGQLPAGSTWEVRQGPDCNMAQWTRRDRQEVCFYDRSGKLVASNGRAACGIYCSGLKAVNWGEPPDGCWNTMLAAGAQCLADGTEVPLPPQPRPAPDARPDTWPYRPVDAGFRDGRPVDSGVPPPLDARRVDAGVPPPPPSPALDGGVD